MRRGKLTLSNEESARGSCGPIVLPNSFALASDDFVEVPYGEHRHESSGLLQRLTREAAERMANSFASVRSRLARAFGGLPFYRGHPDDPAFAARDTDQAAVGWIEGIEPTANAMRLRVKWADAGRGLLQGGAFKFFSPRWAVARAGSGGAVVEPYELISCGLTNRPQIPVPALANEGTNRKEKTMLDWLRKKMGLADAASETEIQAKVDSTFTELANERTGRAAAETARQTAETALASEKTARAAADTAKQSAETALANEKTARAAAETAQRAERKERIALLISNAVADGRVIVADQARWTEALEKDFGGESVKLANAQKVVKTGAATEGLAGRKAGIGAKGDQIVVLVNEKIKSGMRYDDAWFAVKRARPELFG